MINGQYTEFISKLYYGDEMTFQYDGHNYFIQGWTVDDKQILVLDCLNTKEFTDYIWQDQKTTMKECAESFLSAPIWNGKAFSEIQREVTWID